MDNGIRAMAIAEGFQVAGLDHVLDGQIEPGVIEGAGEVRGRSAAQVINSKYSVTFGE